MSSVGDSSLNADKQLLEHLAIDTKEHFSEFENAYSDRICTRISGLLNRLVEDVYVAECIQLTLVYIQKSLGKKSQSDIKAIPDLEKWVKEAVEEAVVEYLLKLLAISVQRHFSILYATYEPRIRYHIAKALHKSRDDSAVADCVQDVFLGISRTLSRKSADEILALKYLTAYHYETANHVVNKYRRKHVQIEAEISISSDEESPEFQIEQDTFEGPGVALEFTETLNELPAVLTKNQRRAVGLIFIEGLTSSEAAIEMNENENTVKSYVHRARKKLDRKYWEEKIEK